MNTVCSLCRADHQINLSITAPFCSHYVFFAHILLKHQQKEGFLSGQSQGLASCNWIMSINNPLNMEKPTEEKKIPFPSPITLQLETEHPISVLSAEGQLDFYWPNKFDESLWF